MMKGKRSFKISNFKQKWKNGKMNKMKFSKNKSDKTPIEMDR